jgi:predicted oxidoreductase (fatty acid repression mutant protein)
LQSKAKQSKAKQSKHLSRKAIVKITKWVEAEAEVEIDITIAVVVREMPRNAENQRTMLQGMSTCIAFWNAIPDDMLAAINEKQHSILMEHINKIQARFAAIQPIPAPETA